MPASFRHQGYAVRHTGMSSLVRGWSSDGAGSRQVGRAVGLTTFGREMCCEGAGGRSVLGREWFLFFVLMGKG